MAAVSKSFYETPNRQGLVIGILRGDESLEESKDGGPNPKDRYPKPRDGYPKPRDAYPHPKHGYANQWVEIPVLTHLPLSGERGMEPMSRNHINVLTSDVIVALPGDAGTLSEVRLAVRYERPVIAFVESDPESDGESDVESDHGIPGLPKGVPTSNSLEEVQTFVLAQLGLSALRG